MNNNQMFCYFWRLLCGCAIGFLVFGCAKTPPVANLTAVWPAEGERSLVRLRRTNWHWWWRRDFDLGISIDNDSLVRVEEGTAASLLIIDNPGSFSVLKIGSESSPTIIRLYRLGERNRSSVVCELMCGTVQCFAASIEATNDGAGPVELQAIAQVNSEGMCQVDPTTHGNPKVRTIASVDCNSGVFTLAWRPGLRLYCAAGTDTVAVVHSGQMKDISLGPRAELELGPAVKVFAPAPFPLSGNYDQALCAIHDLGVESTDQFVERLRGQRQHQQAFLATERVIGIGGGYLSPVRSSGTSK